MRILITGGCGFVGSNLAARGMARGDEITLFDNLSRCGSDRNLRWLKGLGQLEFIRGDVRDAACVDALFANHRFDGVFHLAGQVAMTVSVADPKLDFETNTGGTFHVLDAIRRLSPETALLYSSTNKIYGDLEQYEYIENQTRYLCPRFPRGFDENTPIDMHSPYGVSKGSADQYVLDFARIYHLRTAVFRHSSMFGGRQFATFDQGWVGWFCAKALEQRENAAAEPFTISGSGKQVRDLLHADDVASLYYSALEKIDLLKGNAFNIGGGMENSLSLLELFAFLEEKLGVKLRFHKLPPRLSDQKIFVADSSKLRARLGWRPQVDRFSGVGAALEWVKENREEP